MEYNGFCVRVQALEGYAEKIMTFPLSKDYDAIVSMRHKGSTGENPHYHLVIRTNVKQQAFRVRLKKIFDLGSGNEHMSIKNWDGNIDAISYLFHEDPTGTPHLVYNVSPDTIEKARQRNVEVTQKVTAAKEKASWKIEEELMKIYEAKQIKPDLHTVSKDILLFALRNDKYPPNDFLLKSMANKILFRLQAGDLNREEEFAKMYISNLYRMDYDAHIQWMSRGGT